MKKIFLITLLFAMNFSYAQNSTFYIDEDNPGLISIKQNNIFYNFEIYQNNELKYQDSSCYVFFSPCGNCCEQIQVIVLQPKPHLLVYSSVDDVNYKKHLLIKQDSLGRIIVLNYLNEQIIFARIVFKGWAGDCLISCTFLNNNINICFDELWVKKNDLIPPYQPNKTYTFPLPKN